MEFNESQYNIIVEKNNDYIYIYNSFYGSLVKVEDRVYRLFHNKVINDDNKIEYFDILRKEGIIKPISLNEFNKIIINEKTEIYSKNKNKLTFVLVPTMNCNLRCNYCFEKEYRCNKKLLDENIPKIIKFILSRINKNTKKIHITWFGGEPMLEYAFVCNFSKDIIEAMNKMNIQYTSSMITNGVLLDKNKICNLVENCCISRYQITVDGTEQYYCDIKKTIPADYSRLMINIKELCKYAKVSIRLNSNKTNYEDLKKVTKNIMDICENSRNLNFYLAKLINYDNQCNLCNFSQEEFDDKKIEYKKYYLSLIDKDYKISLPKYRGCFCGLFTINNFVIGPELKIYKCEHDVGNDDKVIGNVEYGIYYSDYMVEFLENKILDQCKECSIFPLCLGGCPNQKRVLSKGNSCYYSEKFIVNLVKQWIK